MQSPTKSSGGELWVKHGGETAEVLVCIVHREETCVQAGEIKRVGLVVCTATTREFDGINLWFSK